MFVKAFVPDHELFVVSRADVFTDATLVSTYVFVVKSLVFTGVRVDEGKLELKLFVPVQVLLEVSKLAHFVST